METINILKMIQFLEMNKNQLTDWYIKFVKDIRTRLINNQSVTEKQKLVLFQETRRIFFHQHLTIFED